MDIEKRTVKGSCRIPCECSKSARERRIALYSDQQQGCTEAGSGSVCCQCVNGQCVVSVVLCDRFEHSKCMLNATGSGVDRSVVSMLTVALPCDRSEHSKCMVDGSRVRNGSVC